MCIRVASLCTLLMIRNYLLKKKKKELLVAHRELVVASIEMALSGFKIIRIFIALLPSKLIIPKLSIETALCQSMQIVATPLCG
jgi:hypothetical protein